jgi:hypothetical protein
MLLCLWSTLVGEVVLFGASLSARLCGLRGGFVVLALAEPHMIDA